MMHHLEIAQVPDRLREEPLSAAEAALDVPPPAVDAPARVDETGVELKRGAFLNTIAMLASNFRGIFTFLVARLLGPAALGIFSVAWSTTDILSKIGVLGLDNASSHSSRGPKLEANAPAAAPCFESRLFWESCNPP